MNKYLIEFHVKEAQEEIVTLLKLLELESTSEVEVKISFEHIYNHINTAWNSRNQTDKEAANLSEKEFYFGFV